MKNLKKFQEFALTQDEQKNVTGGRLAGGGSIGGENVGNCPHAPMGCELEWVYVNSYGTSIRTWGSSLEYMEIATQNVIVSTIWC